jgi:metal-sulfur cluster biosynthetic enzyme
VVKVKGAAKKLSPKEEEICEKLKGVKDLEFGFSMVERNWVDEINIKGKFCIKKHVIAEEINKTLREM